MGKGKKSRFVKMCLKKWCKEEERITMGKEPRVPVWKKESTLEYEKELRLLQIKLLKF